MKKLLLVALIVMFGSVHFAQAEETVTNAPDAVEAVAVTGAVDIAIEAPEAVEVVKEAEPIDPDSTGNKTLDTVLKVIFAILGSSFVASLLENLWVINPDDKPWLRAIKLLIKRLANNHSSKVGK